MVKDRKERLQRAFLNVFILFHLYIMAVWGLPGSNFRFQLTRPVNAYVIWSGLWHSWDMFSPDPLSMNFDIEAQITYQNGMARTWVFPQMGKLSYAQRFQKERYRKWRERVRMDIYSGVWDDTARYIARLNDTPTNHPVQVALIRRWEPIPPPVTVPHTKVVQDYQPMIRPLAYPFKYHFKIYDVQRGDL